jgi:DNA-binding NarL/FixJ family response regulator
VMTLEFRPAAAFRSCFRCGNDFRQDGGNRICPGCRNHEPRRKRPLNPNLSFRERQVVNLVSQAKLNKEIAYELHLTEGTIKEYLNRIFRKLGMSNRTELAVWALTHMPRPAEERSFRSA